MITEAKFRKIALALPHALEKPHFDRAGFRVDVPKGKMFVTLAGDGKSCNVFLAVDEQAMLTGAEPAIFSKVPNKWGDKGATTIRLAACDEATLRSALIMSWRHAAPPKYHGELTV
ncbi:MAG: MmcQ/YjbR family DNA-binding protein [Hyphomonas sp.]|uniref:MmcQ/YjbR family DNA-binding protein n=1 Tax=Hyphomonas sp. TaxID=87 RepID=UPI003527F923